MSSRPRIAVIGAGVAGLTLARQLQSMADVTVLEKSRGVGGRLATRDNPPWAFDHGAQYFTARDTGFQALLEPLLDRGAVSDWRPRITTLSPGEKPYKRDWFEPHYVPHGAMNTFGKLLAEGLPIRTATRVTALARDGRQWWLEVDNGGAAGPFDWVVSAVPAPQAVSLLPTTFSATAALMDVLMSGCFTLMLGLNDEPDWPFDCAVVKDSPLGWLSLDHRRPGRKSAPALLVHSSNVWADAHLDDDDERVMADMLASLAAVLPTGAPAIVHRQLHRWRYADVRRPLGEDFWLDPDTCLGVCGDWCIGGRVESAFLSGDRLAKALRARLC
ncbi:MAG: hypothetical protein RLZZ385_1160 [Pseudomonadota bacterium]|jgi:predicted NAD/FAD-dependent oxidoreductase